MQEGICKTSFASNALHTGPTNVNTNFRLLVRG